jgi:hypothetical protein
MRVTSRFIFVLFLFLALNSYAAIAAEGEASDESSNTTAAEPQNTDGATPPATEPDTSLPAANVKARTTYTVDDFGVVNVVDSWEGLAQESGSYMYVSATRELGRIPVRVKDHKFGINYATRSYLYADDEDATVFYLRTPLFFYESGRLSIELTIDLGNRLSFVEMMAGSQQPDSINGSVMKWNLDDANGATLFMKLSRNKPFLIPGEGGPQFDPGSLPYLTGDEIPRNADEALRELETIIMIAEKEGNADEDFIKLLKKSLSKLYYLYYLYGLVTDYEPGGGSAG